MALPERDDDVEPPEHEQKHIQVGDLEAEVDAGIAPLIRELWKAGIDTANSCQENPPGIVWIEFMTMPASS